MDRTGRLLVFLLLVWAPVAVRISQAQSDFDVRIGAGTDPGNSKRGIVEVYYKSKWGSICSTGWDFEDAAVACRKAIPAFAWVKYKSWDIDEGNVTSTVWLDDLQCTGSENNFDDCTSNNKWTSQTCTGRAAAVECQNFAIASGALSAFLFGGLGYWNSAVDGNAFLGEGPNGQFFYLCGIGWSLTDADVFCRKGGHYGASKKYDKSYFGVHPGAIAEADVWSLPVDFQCSGTESSLVECPAQSVNSAERCYDGNNAGAVCLFREEPEDLMVRLVGCTGGQGNVGRVEVKYNGTWGSVGAPPNPRTTAYGDVICRMMNKGYAEAVTTSRDDCGDKEDLEPVIVDTVECTGAETSIAQCGRHLEFVYDEYQNMSRDDSVVVCSGEVPVKEKPIKLDKVKVTAKFAAQGFLSIYEKGGWFTVCNKEWTLKNAQVVCRELKYGPPLKKFESTFESSTMGPMLRRYPGCRGDEDSLAKCGTLKVMARQECSHNQDVYIGCSHNTEPYTVRLNPNKPSSYGRGPVEIFYEGLWGSICTDKWDVKDAFVACRQLGFNWVENRGWEHNATTLDGKKWLNNMACTGRETALKDCQNDGHENQLFQHVCITTASVECGSISGYNEATAFIEGGFGEDTVTAEGLAYLQITAAEQVAICDHSWTKANADVFCRQIGKLSAQRAVSGSYYGRHRSKNGIFPVRKWNMEFQCDGTEVSLAQCVTFARPDGDCPDGRDAGVVCLSQEAPKDFKIRLRGGIDNKEGRVEVFYNATWGSLGKNNHLENPYNFGDVVCRELNQGYATDVSLDDSYGRGDDLIKMDNIWCAGSEDSLAQCGPFIDWIDSSDASLKDDKSGVICSGPPANNRYPVRLSEPANKRGYVEIFYNGRFGTVCDKGWTLANAQVVCRELGLGPPSKASFGLKGFGGPIYLQDVNCAGTESSLDQCPHGDWMVHSCDHSMDVSVMCQDGVSGGSHLTTPILLATILYIVQATLHKHMF